MVKKNKYKYEYQPLVKNPRDDIHLEGENVRTNMYRPPCLRLKIEINYTTKCSNLILFDKNEADNTRNKIELNKVDDLYNYMKYLSKIRGAVEINKLYALKNNNLNGKKNYGIILKLVTVECINNYMKINEAEENDNKGFFFLILWINIFTN